MITHPRFAGVQGDAAARSTMLPHVSSLIPISARTLDRHCRMTQVVHDDVAEHSDAESDADDACASQCEACDTEDHLEGTGRIRSWLKKKLKDAMGVVEHTLHAAPSHVGFGGNSSAPVATTPTAQASNEGAQTLAAREVTPEQSDAHSSPVRVHSAATPTREDVAGPSRTVDRAAGGESPTPEIHMHNTSPVRAHVTFSEGAAAQPTSPYAAKAGGAGRVAGSASPSSSRGAAAVAATGADLGAPDQGQSQGRSGKSGNGRKHVHGAPLPMLTGLDTSSKALCSFVAQGYKVCFLFG